MCWTGPFVSLAWTTPEWCQVAGSLDVGAVPLLCISQDKAEDSNTLAWYRWCVKSCEMAIQQEGDGRSIHRAFWVLQFSKLRSKKCLFSPYWDSGKYKIVVLNEVLPVSIKLVCAPGKTSPFVPITVGGFQIIKALKWCVLLTWCGIKLSSLHRLEVETFESSTAIITRNQGDSK